MSVRQIKRARARKLQRDDRRAQASLRRRATLAAGAALGATVAFAPAAGAATFEVNSLDDSGDGTCDAAVDGCTLRDAVEEAASEAGADTVTFASSLSGRIELSQGNGLDVPEALTVQGPGRDVLTVDANTESEVFYVNAASDETVSISGLTLTAGARFPAGGAIEAPGGTLTVADSRITQSFAFSGGAVSATGEALEITNTEVYNNIAAGAGAGVYSGVTGALRISNSTFSLNDSFNYGGAVSVFGGQEPTTITGSTFTENSGASEGGGLLVAGTDGAPVTIEDSTLSGNDADRGGGIYVRDVADAVTIQNSTISRNSAEEYGAGINVDATGDGEVTVRNSTVARNIASEYAGGIGLYAETDDDTLTLSSTIVADNEPDDVSQSPGSGEFDAGFSLIEDVGGATVVSNPVGSNITGRDPLLGPLADNGGPTRTHLLAFESPAVDAGVANGLSQDQRGFGRPLDAPASANRAGSDGSDIGALELQVDLCQDNQVPLSLGTSQMDILTGTGVAETIRGGGGEDGIFGLDGRDCLFGDAGADEIDGDAGADVVVGGADDDRLSGRSGADRIAGDEGDDDLAGNAGGDQISGGDGNDELTGGGGADKLRGNAGADRLRGESAADKLKGAEGEDLLKGGGADDRLVGGRGADRVNCGAGDDVAIVDRADRVSASCETVK